MGTIKTLTKYVCITWDNFTPNIRRITVLFNVCLRLERLSSPDHRVQTCPYFNSIPVLYLNNALGLWGLSKYM